MSAAQREDAPLQPRADCTRCVYFAVSWDPAKPYLCKSMGFKSRYLPSTEVLRAAGHVCQVFVAKTAPLATAGHSPGAALTGPLAALSSMPMPLKSQRSTRVWEA